MDKKIKDRYQILELLGKGGVAAVYRARDEVLDREVAIKILDERCARDGAFVERFRREAQAAAGIHHPNVVKIFDTGEDDGAHFIVMEFVAGATLKDILSGRPLPMDRAVKIALQVAGALAHAHRSGIIHRDVKAKNIILTPEGVAKIADFGIARALDKPGITQTGKVLGTAEYLSPEQAVGRIATEQSDIYAFGVVLYEMLTGSPPFTGSNPVEVAAKQISQEPPKAYKANPDVPRVLSDFLDCLLAKEPDSRPASFDEVVRALEPWVSADETTLPLPVTGSTGTVTRPISMWLKVALTLSTLVAIAGVFYLSLQQPVKRTTTTARPPAPVVTVPVTAVAVSDFDPEGNGSEHPEQVQSAFDGRLSTSWSTVRYANERFGNLKTGVGFYADLGEPHRIKRIRVRSESGGWNAQVKGSNDKKDWSVLASKDNMPKDHTFAIAGTHRYYMIWVTKLTTLPGREGFRVAVSEVEFAQ